MEGRGGDDYDHIVGDRKGNDKWSNRETGGVLPVLGNSEKYIHHDRRAGSMYYDAPTINNISLEKL